VNNLRATSGEQNKGLAERNVELFAGIEIQFTNVVTTIQIKTLIENPNTTHAECPKAQDWFTAPINSL